MSLRTERSRRRFNRLWKRLDAGVDEVLAPAKDATLVDLPAGVVEIGPGHGSNFPRYAKGTKLIAFEPNVFMHEILRERADLHGIGLDLRSRGVEAMDLPTDSADVVISSLVLCSVDDRDVALAEIRRILKPGGRMIFIEHIAADSGTGRARLQRLLRRPWRAFADQCDPMADTVRAINDAGFAEVSVDIEVLGPRLDPSSLTAYGVARA